MRVNVQKRGPGHITPAQLTDLDEKRWQRRFQQDIYSGPKMYLHTYKYVNAIALYQVSVFVLKSAFVHHYLQ